MKKLLPYFLSLFVIYSSFGQGDDNVREVNARPDLPGSLIFDLGFNFLSDHPDDMDIGFWGSKSVGIYYQYHLNLGNSKFSFNPGIGLGLEKYKFDQDVTLSYVDDGLGRNDLQLVGLDSLIGPFDFKKSKLAADYLDIPAEIRFYLRKSRDGGFRVAVGGKIGILFSAHTKIKYKESGNTKKLKLKDDFQLRLFRYTAYTRLGWPGFQLFYEMGLSDLFEKDNGPEATTTSPYKFGLSITVF